MTLKPVEAKKASISFAFRWFICTFVLVNNIPI